MKTLGSTIASAAMTWLMLQVPAMIDASPGVDDARAERARHHVEEAGDHRRALGEPGGGRGLGGDAAGDVGRPQEVGQQVDGVGEAVAFEQVVVVDAHPAGAAKPAPLMSEMSETRRPVRRKVTKSLQKKAVPARA